MRDPEAWLVDVGLPVEEQVEVERPRPLARHALPPTPEPTFDGEEQVEERPRRQLRVQRGDPVQEPGLVEIADGVGLEQRRYGRDLDRGRGGERSEGLASRPLPVAEV